MMRQPAADVYGLPKPSPGLPIPVPRAADGVARRRLRHGEALLTLGRPAMILAPRHPSAVGFEARADDVVMGADLGATDAGGERLSAVREGLGGRAGLSVVGIETARAAPSSATSSHRSGTRLDSLWSSKCVFGRSPYWAFPP